MCGSAEGSHPNSEHAESLAVLTHPATLRLIHCKTPLACHAMCVCVCVQESTQVFVPFFFPSTCFISVIPGGMHMTPQTWATCRPNRVLTL